MDTMKTEDRPSTPDPRPLTIDHQILTAEYLSLVDELLARYGSPLYVYDADALRATITRISRSVPFPAIRFHFACVTNGNLALLRIFQEQGWGLHSNTPGDAFLGLKAGFDPARIVYTGSNLTSDEMKQMMREHLDLTLAEAVARLHGDWAADIAAYDRVHQEILQMADMLSTGIIHQFPKKFQ